jgi:DNA-binding CsgD family transcriptional regulator
VNPKLLHQLVGESGRAAPGPDLTQREREVLRMLADGSDLTVIAKEMSISVHTCRGHVQNVQRSWGALPATQAVVVAMRYGLIETGHGPRVSRTPAIRLTQTARPGARSFQFVGRCAVALLIVGIATFEVQEQAVQPAGVADAEVR